MDPCSSPSRNFDQELQYNVGHRKARSDLIFLERDRHGRGPHENILYQNRYQNQVRGHPQEWSKTARHPNGGRPVANQDQPTSEESRPSARSRNIDRAKSAERQRGDIRPNNSKGRRHHEDFDTGAEQPCQNRSKSTGRERPRSSTPIFKKTPTEQLRSFDRKTTSPFNPFTRSIDAKEKRPKTPTKTSTSANLPYDEHHPPRPTTPSRQQRGASKEKLQRPIAPSRGRSFNSEKKNSPADVLSLSQTFSDKAAEIMSRSQIFTNRIKRAMSPGRQTRRSSVPSDYEVVTPMMDLQSRHTGVSRVENPISRQRSFGDKKTATPMTDLQSRHTGVSRVENPVSRERSFGDKKTASKPFTDAHESATTMFKKIKQDTTPTLFAHTKKHVDMDMKGKREKQDQVDSYRTAHEAEDIRNVVSDLSLESPRGHSPPQFSSRYAPPQVSAPASKRQIPNRLPKPPGRTTTQLPLQPKFYTDGVRTTQKPVSFSLSDDSNDAIIPPPPPPPPPCTQYAFSEQEGECHRYNAFAESREDLFDQAARIRLNDRASLVPESEHGNPRKIAVVNDEPIRQVINPATNTERVQSLPSLLDIAESRDDDQIPAPPKSKPLIPKLDDHKKLEERVLTKKKLLIPKRKPVPFGLSIGQNRSFVDDVEAKLDEIRRRRELGDQSIKNKWEEASKQKVESPPKPRTLEQTGVADGTITQSTKSPAANLQKVGKTAGKTAGKKAGGALFGALRGRASLRASPSAATGGVVTSKSKETRAVESPSKGPPPAQAATSRTTMKSANKGENQEPERFVPQNSVGKWLQRRNDPWPGASRPPVSRGDIFQMKERESGSSIGQSGGYSSNSSDGHSSSLRRGRSRGTEPSKPPISTVDLFGGDSVNTDDRSDVVSYNVLSIKPTTTYDRAVRKGARKTPQIKFAVVELGDEDDAVEIPGMNLNKAEVEHQLLGFKRSATKRETERKSENNPSLANMRDLDALDLRTIFSDTDSTDGDSITEILGGLDRLSAKISAVKDGASLSGLQDVQMKQSFADQLHQLQKPHHYKVPNCAAYR
jgi:hypothetical protein